MPNYKGHLVGGAIFYVIAVYLFLHFCPQHVSGVTAFGWLLCTLAGSLFPDIDTKSKGQKYFYFILLWLFVLLLYFKKTELVALLAVVAFIPLVVRHRGIFHQLWFVCVITFIVALCLCNVFPHCEKSIQLDALFFALGALSHLWLDLGVRRLFG